MPGEAAAYPEGDLFPTTREEYEKIKSWCKQTWSASYTAAMPQHRIWRKCYKLYDSYVAPRPPGEWRSRVFMPESFQTVETILPRLIAQLPKFLAQPRGPEDSDNAKKLTRELEYAAETSNLHLELVDVNRDRLIYGTGILKTYHDQIPAYGREMVPVFEEIEHTVQRPVIDPETLQPVTGPDGQVVTEPEVMKAKVPAGMQSRRKKIIAYEGPMGKAVDPFHFFPAPESQDIDSARYVIHRTYPEFSKVKELVAAGVYHWPDDLDPEELEDENLWTQPDDDPHKMRLDSVNMGPGNDPTRRQCEVLEWHTSDGRIISMLNRRAIIRVQQLPFDHNQKPFCIFYDYKKPHEFWGKGEVEIISGLQNLINSLVNQRIDNVRLGMDQGYVVNTAQLKKPSQLKRKPGQVVEVLGDGMQPSDIVHPLPTTEVTSSAFMEADQAKQWSERTTGNSGYQQGMDTPSMNDTATGVSIITEQGANRFAVKSKIDEIGPYKRLGLHFGSMIQQFTSRERRIRLVGEDGQEMWDTLDPLSVMGAFDFTIESSSVVQSETVKREQAISLLRELAPILASPNPLPPGVMHLVEDVLEAFGRKNTEKFIAQMGQPQMPPPGQPGQPGPPGQQMPAGLEQIMALAGGNGAPQ